MRISQVKVINHSRIRDLELDIRVHVVIIGANDAGLRRDRRPRRTRRANMSGDVCHGTSVGSPGEFRCSTATSALS